MYYYEYDTKRCILLNEISEDEKTETSVCSGEQYDLDLYDVYVGILSKDGNRRILKETKILKRDAAIIRKIEDISKSSSQLKESISVSDDAILDIAEMLSVQEEALSELANMISDLVTGGETA